MSDSAAKDKVLAPRQSSPSSIADLFNPSWEQASGVTITQLWSGQEAVSSRHAEARVCWSDEALHVRFVGQQNEPLVVNQTPVTERKTLGLWDRDVCEIFIA